MFCRSLIHKLFSNLVDREMKNTTRRDKLIALEPRAKAIW
jgi:hypothetical protein